MQPSKPGTPLTPNEPLTLPLHPAEEKLLRFLRDLRFGTLQRLVVRDGLPSFAEEVIQTIRFD
jgi:hypothetical protein